MKIYLNGPGHKTNMATMPIYMNGKNLKKIFSGIEMIVGMQHQVLKYSRPVL